MHMCNNTTQQKEKGFTLIEVIFAVALFAVVAVVALGTLLTSTTANRKSKTERVALDSLGFALDDMTQNIRFGNNYDCSSNPIPTENECLWVGSETISLIGAGGTTVMYQRGVHPSSGYGVIQRSDGVSGWLNLTDPNVSIDFIRFYVISSISASPPRFPRVLISVRGRAVNSDTKAETPFAFQTTVTKRFAIPQ